MLRIACCLAIERGVEVCVPVHDAVLICAPLEQIEDDIAAMSAAMAEAARFVLAGFELSTDVKVTRWPDRYMDPREAARCGSRLQSRGTGRAATNGAGRVSYKFIKFPKMWQACLAEKRADGSTYRVVLYLLDRAAFSEHEPLGNAALKRHGVSQRSKWRALSNCGRPV